MNGSVKRADYDMSPPTVFLLPTMKNTSSDVRILEQEHPPR